LRISGEIVKKCLGIIGECFEECGVNNVSDIYDSFNPYTCIISRVKYLSTPPLWFKSGGGIEDFIVM